jgi:hypothetical protein
MALPLEQHRQALVVTRKGETGASTVFLCDERGSFPHPLVSAKRFCIIQFIEIELTCTFISSQLSLEHVSERFEVRGCIHVLAEPLRRRDMHKENDRHVQHHPRHHKYKPDYIATPVSIGQGGLHRSPDFNCCLDSIYMGCPHPTRKKSVYLVYS